MAAKTPSSVKIASMGNLRLLVATFADLDDGDTWASGLTNQPVWNYWAHDTDNPTTQASVGIACSYSAGTFTLYPAEDNKTGKLFVLIGGGQ